MDLSTIYYAANSVFLVLSIKNHDPSSGQASGTPPLSRCAPLSTSPSASAISGGNCGPPSCGSADAGAASITTAQGRHAQQQTGNSNRARLGVTDNILARMPDW